MKRIDLNIGSRFGKYTTTGDGESRLTSGKKRLFYPCMCDCGTERWISVDQLRSGDTVSCGCGRKGRKTNAKWPRLANHKALLARYKGASKSRGHKFDLSDEEFRGLIKQPCWYCGVEPMQVLKYRLPDRSHLPNGDFLYNGIDRLDSSIGYEASNCVACCGKCNVAKHVMGYEEFIAWIEVVYNNLSRRGMLASTALEEKVA